MCTLCSIWIYVLLQSFGIFVPTNGKIEHVMYRERPVAKDRMMKACLPLLVSPQ